MMDFIMNFLKYSMKFQIATIAIREVSLAVVALVCCLRCPIYKEVKTKVQYEVWGQ